MQNLLLLCTHADYDVVMMRRFYEVKYVLKRGLAHLVMDHHISGAVSKNAELGRSTIAQELFSEHNYFSNLLFMQKLFCKVSFKY